MTKNENSWIRSKSFLIDHSQSNDNSTCDAGEPVPCVLKHTRVEWISPGVRRARAGRERETRQTNMYTWVKKKAEKDTHKHTHRHTYTDTDTETKKNKKIHTHTHTHTHAEDRITRRRVWKSRPMLKTETMISEVAFSNILISSKITDVMLEVQAAPQRQRQLLEILKNLFYFFWNGFIMQPNFLRFGFSNYHVFSKFYDFSRSLCSNARTVVLNQRQVAWETQENHFFSK